jgi:hypothetical protein
VFKNVSNNHEDVNFGAFHNKSVFSKGVENSINMENIDFGLVDKEEIVASVTFTGTYLEATRTEEPWSCEYVD